jgi:hypothetical protein
MNRSAFPTEKTLMLTFRIGLFFIVTSFGACVVAPVNNVEKMLYKPNITQQEYAKDRFECMKESQQTQYQARGATGGGIFYEPGQAKGEVVTNKELYDLCMQARGYRFTEGNSLPGDFTGSAPFTYGNGDTYEGDWVNGKQHGKGIYTTPDGGRLEADWFNGDARQGTFRYANGNKYVGEFVNSKRQGKGTFTFKAGDTYEGYWANDRPHGKGMYIWADGHTYEGDWANGNFQGRGTYRYVNGDTYEGEFFNDRFAGKGTFTCANGKQFTGNLENKLPKELTERCN